MGLRLKFNLVMAAAMVVGLGLATLFTARFLEQNARDEVMREASLMAAQAAAVRGYTSREIEPLLRQQMTVRFLPHSVPSWATQTMMRTILAQFPNYTYKDAVHNPTNPADRPSDWEAEIIEQFKRDRKLPQLVTTRDTTTGPVLSLSRPIVITDRNCLRCHSTPAEAPQTMVDLYGAANGFAWPFNEVIGAQIVSIPTAVATNRANRLMVLYVGALAAVFAVVIVIVNVLLQYVIIGPVRRISAAATDVSMGNMDAPEVEIKGGDEIASLSESFNRMRRSLANALKMLG